MKTEINELVFGKNDIRGIVGNDLNPEFYNRLGKAFVTDLKNKGENKISLSVGYDARNHSPEFKDALIKGLIESGADVYDLGLCPTPLCYYSEYIISGLISTLVVTASHNPPEYNGLKMTYNKTSYSEEDISNLKEIMIKGDFYISEKKGELKRFDIISDYTDYMLERFNGLGKGVKVVIDSANATGGVVAPDLYRKIGCEVVDIYSEPDGNFPNHHPNPSSVENLKDLQAKVLETEADFGIAFDGDSDRIGVVDDKGRCLSGDRLMLIFALDIISSTNEQSPAFVSEVKCSQVLYDTIEKHGGRAIMWKTGHGYIKNKMKEEKALLAGEMSGHIFFKDRYFGFDDAVYAGCRFIEIVAAKKLEDKQFSVSDFINSFPGTFTSEEVRLPCPDSHKYSIVEELQAEFSSKPDLFSSKIVDVIKIDGVRLVFPDGFALIRASNTEPVFTMRFEAGSQENLNNYQSKMLEVVNKKLNTAKKVISGMI